MAAELNVRDMRGLPWVITLGWAIINIQHIYIVACVTTSATFT